MGFVHQASESSIEYNILIVLWVICFPNSNKTFKRVGPATICCRVLSWACLMLINIFCSVWMLRPNLSSAASDVLHEEVEVFFSREDGGCRWPLSPFVEHRNLVRLEKMNQDLHWASFWTFFKIWANPDLFLYILVAKTEREMPVTGIEPATFR